MAWTERYCSPTGGGAHDGTTTADAWTLAEAIAGVAAGQRVNVIAGTYASTTTDRAFATAGTTIAPIWWRGYNTAIGDIDTDNTLTKPVWTFTTGRITIAGAFQLFSNLDISGAQTTLAQVNPSGGTIRFDRCRIECTAASANGRAIYLSGSAPVTLSRCWLKATSSAPVAEVQVDTTFLGCTVVGGSNGLLMSGTTNNVVYHCTFNVTGGDAIRVTAASCRVWVLGCTVYSPTSDGIEVTTTLLDMIVADNLFANCGGYGDNYSTGTNTFKAFRVNNDFYLNTSGTETGFGDSPSLSQQTESVSPFTNAAGGDLSLISTSNAKATGLAGKFENQSYTSYLDIGAVQRQEPAASSGPTKQPPLIWFDPESF